ncbi:MAG: LamG-like jellyroll fold domain-containing protein [Opitutaceae bacterium]|nr:LamG-like jellyroll fold domain-containing protein [Opitutaceae bacterium]
MTLTDREILELNELCGAVVEGTLTEPQRARLTAWLRESEAARRFYVRALGQSASLLNYAAEMHADAPERVRAPVSGRRWAAVLPAMAAMVLGVLLVYRTGRERSDTPATAKPAAVGRITAVKNATAKSGAEPVRAGANVFQGQRFELARGYAEITFDSGARVVVEGAASLEINSAWDATLRHGAVTVTVPPEALGFRLSNPAVEVVDLGTEFSMIADARGAADVLVLNGEVEAAPRGRGDAEVILLRQHESRRFEPSGVSIVADSEKKFARFAAPPGLDRFSRAVRSAHWSFDDAGSGGAMAGSAGLSGPAIPMRIQNGETSAAGRAVEGRHGRALRFDGSIHAEAIFPGIAEPHHTIAFWVRVAKDAPLSDAYSMASWVPKSPKLAHRPVGINWNRDPAEGPVGALRTDFAGGCAIGATSLRDDKWHHVAVCFAAGENDGPPVQVKQYVDGRLESSGIIPGQTRGPAGAEDPAFADVVWLGCRVKASGPQRQKFRGEIDEFFIADRILGPEEIVHLMRENELPPSTVASR